MDHDQNLSVKHYEVGDRVYYEDLTGDYCLVKEVIEVTPFLMYVYRVEFDDGCVLHTTNEGLRRNENREPVRE